MVGQGSTIHYVFIVDLILSALFIVLIYSGRRIKKQLSRIIDIKQQKIDLQDELLKQLSGEKEWLLKEIHHRVKNNLQIVISLLSTQSAYLENEDALLAIRNSQNRMYAMSLIHQKLYQFDNLAEIDMNWYIKELVDYLKEWSGTDKKIDFVVETAFIKLDAVQAIPMGLILNEAISNAIKYAFPGDRKGKVKVFFGMREDFCILKISDDGIGLPEDFEQEGIHSLGMNLITGLSKQLDGDLKIWNRSGLMLEVCFSPQHELLEYKKPG